jgi:enamine deaminase RidA (YjgF/YER057c/UK114 family)
VAPADLEAQALHAAENLHVARAEAGTGPDDLLKTTIYVVGENRSDLGPVWDVVSPLLDRVPNTLLGVSFLDYPDRLVEIEAIALADTHV